MLLTFCLPLSSKVNVTKCFLMSQLCYYGSIIEPTAAQTSTIEKVILSFLFPRLATISASRTFFPISKGGLGIPPVSEFLRFMRIKFSIRANNSKQPWAREVRLNFPSGNICLKPLYPNPVSAATSLMQSHIDNCIFLQQIYYNNSARCWSSTVFNSIFSNNIIEPFNRINPAQTIIQCNILQGKLIDLINYPSRKIKSFGEFITKFPGATFNLYFHARNLVLPILTKWKPPPKIPKVKTLETFAKKKPTSKIHKTA